MPEVMTQPKCRRCNGELTRDEKRNCWECLACYPKNRVQAAPPKTEKKYIDVAMSEGRVREIVRDELENWHIQKPSVTKSETEEIDTALRTDWRQQAKELGINTFQMKKVDVLAAIAEKAEDGKGNI